MNGNRHDSHMLRESGLLYKLKNMMPIDGDVIYSLYSDPAYPQSWHIFGVYINTERDSLETECNTRMSKVREVVEWGFKEIITQWRLLDFRALMKIFEIPVGRYYIIGALLTNFRSLFYDNQTSAYFDCKTISLSEYLALIY